MFSHSGMHNRDMLVDDIYHTMCTWFYIVPHFLGIRLELSTGNYRPRAANFSGVIVHYLLPLMDLYR